MAALHGYILTAWAMAGLAGPILLAETYKMAHSYTQTLFVFLILYSIALALSYYLGRSIKRKSKTAYMIFCRNGAIFCSGLVLY